MKTVMLVVVTLIAFAALALSMDRHAKDVFGAVPAPGKRRALRVGGWFLLGVALVLALIGWGTGVGVVEWTAALTAASALLVLAVLPRVATRREAQPRGAVAGTTQAPHGSTARSVPGRLWWALRLCLLVGLPVLMAWAIMH